MAMGQEELGKLVAQAREDAELTQQQLAKEIGLEHAQSISRYERGLTEIPTKRLRRIAEVTDKPISFFLGTPPTENDLPAEVRDRLAVMEGLLGEVLVELQRKALIRPTRQKPVNDESRRP